MRETPRGASHVVDGYMFPSIVIHSLQFTLRVKDLLGWNFHISQWSIIRVLYCQFLDVMTLKVIFLNSQFDSKLLTLCKHVKLPPVRTFNLENYIRCSSVRFKTFYIMKRCKPSSCFRKSHLGAYKEQGKQAGESFDHDYFNSE